MIKIFCPCGKEIFTSPSRAGRKKYCSKKCFYKFKIRPKGLKYNLKVENKAWFKKGTPPWNKGTVGICKSNSGSIKKGERISKKTEFKKGENKGKKNCKWKGENIGYYGIHTWLQREYGKANICENRDHKILDFKCSNKSNNYDWALKKNKKYRRARSHFFKLCHSCHLKYDKQKCN